MDRFDIARIHGFQDRHQPAGGDVVDDTERADARDADPGDRELAERLAVGLAGAAAAALGLIAVIVSVRGTSTAMA